MLKLDNFSLSAGARELLIGASVHIHPGDKVGLIGRNGTGKTTLLRALMGELSGDGGSVTVRSGAQLGWLPQTAVSGSDRTVWEEASSRMVSHDALKEKLERAQADVEREVPGAVERLESATEAFRISGGWAIEERIGEVLHGLGFAPADWHRSCATFSGGWQMRIALARLLLSSPNVLLLDEPTNHLDISARSWLAKFLSKYSGTVVLVSHDRYLLDHACRRILEIRNKKISDYRGTFSGWMKERELRFLQAQQAFEAQQKEISKLEGFVERFGAKATKAAQAQSRQNRLDRIERLEEPERESKPRLKIARSESSVSEALALRKATVGWGAPLLTDVDLALERGMRLALLGPNGCGKSTLLSTFSGRLPLLSGQRRVGKDVRLGVFSQDLAQDLPADQSALDVVLGRAPRVGPSEVRSALGALGLSGEKALRPVRELSGGERARVALACFAVQSFDVLLLDEPTNHLDAIAVEVLVDALKEYEGAILMVSHDRYVVEQLATHVAHVTAGSIRMHSGVVAEDFEAGALVRVSETRDVQRSDDHQDRKRQQRDRDRMKKRLSVIERELSELEKRNHAITDELVEYATHYEKVKVIYQQQEDLAAQISALYAEWEELETALQS